MLQIFPKQHLIFSQAGSLESPSTSYQSDLLIDLQKVQLNAHFVSCVFGNIGCIVVEVFLVVSIMNFETYLRNEMFNDNLVIEMIFMYDEISSSDRLYSKPKIDKNGHEKIVQWIGH